MAEALGYIVWTVVGGPQEQVLLDTFEQLRQHPNTPNYSITIIIISKHEETFRTVTNVTQPMQRETVNCLYSPRPSTAPNGGAKRGPESLRNSQRLLGNHLVVELTRPTVKGRPLLQRLPTRDASGDTWDKQSKGL